MKTPFIALMMAMPLAACTATGATDQTPAGPATMESSCSADAVQSMIGQKVSGAVGEQILKATGASTLRWGPPRSAMTMDYRTDRVTVSYDDAMIITGISCG
ncbi:MAG TPA: I78 family peptidase inhibitor [Sphingopyxis sp.]|nr:I78 family peptidase inhibitor [Sphingopyxis sp.]